MCFLRRPFATPSAINRRRLWDLGRFSSFRGELTLLAVISSIFLLRVTLEGIPTRRELPTQDMAVRRPANLVSVLGLGDGRLALKVHRWKHVASGAILPDACRGERFDTQGGGLHIPQLLCQVCSIWPIVQDPVKAGDFISPPSRVRTSFED